MKTAAASLSEDSLAMLSHNGPWVYPISPSAEPEMLDLMLRAQLHIYGVGELFTKGDHTFVVFRFRGTENYQA